MPCGLGVRAPSQHLETRAAMVGVGEGVLSAPRPDGLRRLNYFWRKKVTRCPPPLLVGATEPAPAPRAAIFSPCEKENPTPAPTDGPAGLCLKCIQSNPRAGEANSHRRGFIFHGGTNIRETLEAHDFEPAGRPGVATTLHVPSFGVFSDAELTGFRCIY